MGKHVARDSVLSDANDRAWRTLLQQLLVDLLVVGGITLQQALDTGGDPFTAIFWIAVAVSFAKSGLAVVASYLMRLKYPPKL